MRLKLNVGEIGDREPWGGNKSSNYWQGRPGICARKFTMTPRPFHLKKAQSLPEDGTRRALRGVGNSFPFEALGTSGEIKRFT